jgi:hypothetical protein
MTLADNQIARASNDETLAGVNSRSKDAELQSLTIACTGIVNPITEMAVVAALIFDTTSDKNF